LLEIVLTYAFLLLPWPSAFVRWAWEMNAWAILLGWLAVGVPATWGIARFGGRKLFLCWLVFWFMPGTIICGAATLVPWPMALVMAFAQDGCSTALSLGISLVFNAILVLGGAALLRLFTSHVRGT